ncbi:hypothetical protein ACTXT7_014614 [Hymenolepis weldensis]
MMKHASLIDRRHSWFKVLCFAIFMAALVLRVESRYMRSDTNNLFSTKEEISMDRKPVFRNVQELRRYLEQLDEWLAITDSDEISTSSTD